MENRNEKTRNEIIRAMATWIQQVTSGQSLITITDARISSDRKYVTLAITVLPETEEEQALLFLSRKARDAKDFLKGHTRLGRIPFIRFIVDGGEKHRQQLDKTFQEIEEENN